MSFVFQTDERVARVLLPLVALSISGCGPMDAACDTDDLPCEGLGWRLEDGCVPTFVHSSIFWMQGDVAEALEAWNDVACSNLCLLPPVISDELPGAVALERAIFIIPLDLLPWPEIAGDEFLVFSDIRFDTSTLCIEQVVLGINVERDWLDLIGTALRELPHAWGIDHIQPVSEDGRPTEDDIDAMCERYSYELRCGE